MTHQGRQILEKLRGGDHTVDEILVGSRYDQMSLIGTLNSFEADGIIESKYMTTISGFVLGYSLTPIGEALARETHGAGGCGE